MWAWLSQSIPALCPKQWATSFPGPLILPSRPGGGKMRDTGNEVEQWADKIVLSFSEITRWECRTRALKTYLPAITLHTTESRNHFTIKRLQTLECPELLVGVEIGRENERNSWGTVFTNEFSRFSWGYF